MSLSRFPLLSINNVHTTQARFLRYETLAGSRNLVSYPLLRLTRLERPFNLAEIPPLAPQNCQCQSPLLSRISSDSWKIRLWTGKVYYPSLAVLAQIARKQAPFWLPTATISIPRTLEDQQWMVLHYTGTSKTVTLFTKLHYMFWVNIKRRESGETYDNVPKDKRQLGQVTTWSWFLWFRN